MKIYIIIAWVFADATVGPAKLLGLAYCDNSVRDKDWRYCKRGMQAT